MKKAYRFFMIIIPVTLCMISSGFSQVVKDPLLDFYSSSTSAPSISSNPNDRIYVIETHQLGEGLQCVMITSDRLVLGKHGNCAWSLYCKTKNGSFKKISTDSNFIDTGRAGPDYIGYIAEIKHFGAITGTKYSVSATYIDKGALKIVTIDDATYHADAAHYANYFSDTIPNYHITTYTFSQLARLYARPDANNAIKPSF